MGFDIELVRDALKNSSNDMQKAIENLLKMQADGTYADALKNVLQHMNIDPNAPSTSSMPSTSQLLDRLQDREEEMDVSAKFDSQMIVIFNDCIFSRPMNALSKTLSMKTTHIWICH